MSKDKTKKELCDKFNEWCATVDPEETAAIFAHKLQEIVENKKDDDNDKKANVAIIGDPSMLEMLPPFIRDAIVGQMRRDRIEINNKPIPEVKKEKVLYDFNMVNCNVNLKELTKKLKKSKIKKYGILLYGVSGSGKSEYCKYLAQELNMGFIKERASDIFGKWVGESEGNVRKAFDKAREEKAVLVFDEADSFLFDRNMARQAHEVSHTNELFVNMEEHPYPFCMTTNLKDKLDKASIRRFLFKIKFDWMTKDNIKAGLKTYFGKGFKFTEEQYNQLKYISAGDFKIAKEKMDILENGVYTNELIFEYLLAEQTEKDIQEGTAKILL